MDRERSVLRGDVLVTEGRIAAIGPDLQVPAGTRLLDAAGLHVLPGFIQGHVHLGQALFRGLAEERELLPWLRERIWPLEAAHTEESAYWSGLLGALDCLSSGTTTVQEIGLVKGMEGIFRAVRDAGLRAVAGKCLMDTGEGVPPGLLEDTGTALAEAQELARRWEGENGGLIHGALCPRFILSCSRELWAGVAEEAGRSGIPVHTHLLESRAEEEEVRAVLGTGQMEFLDEVGILDTDLRIAHGVWLREPHAEILGGRHLAVVHCPSSNAKLGSGIAHLPYLRRLPNLAVGIGCDGAPCNNDMDMLGEMRLTALLQALEHGPGSLPSEEVLALATSEGARAVGLEGEVGSLEAGKAGDLVVLDLERPQTFGPEGVSVYDRIVYAAGRDAVRWGVVDGEVLLEGGRCPHVGSGTVQRRAAEEIHQLLARADLS